MMRKDFCVGDIRVVLGASQAVESFDAVVVILFASSKVVLVKNEERAWEFPGGHREGDESYEETAARETYEEAHLRITGIERLGHYITPNGQATMIVRAEAAFLQKLGNGCQAPEVGVFDELPTDLSFGDGREHLFLEYAREKRAL